MIVEEKTLKSEMIYEGAILNLRKDEVTVRDGRTSQREIIEHNGGVLILGITKDGKIPMVKQYRKSAECAVLELPAGRLEIGEDLAYAAEREFREETGYRVANIRKVSQFYPAIGYSNELLHLFFATGLTPGETDFDENEAIDIIEYSPEELELMLENNTIIDGKTILGLLWYFDQDRKTR